MGLVVVRTPNPAHSASSEQAHSTPAASPKPRGCDFLCYAAPLQVSSCRNPMRYMGAAIGMGMLTAASVGHGFVSPATVCDKDQAEQRRLVLKNINSDKSRKLMSMHQMWNQKKTMDELVTEI